MEKSILFMKELSLIQDDEIMNFTTHCLDSAPDSFFTMPSSTSGKYHPAYALGEGGLVRHTKAAVRIAFDLLNLEQNQNLFKDLIISALILHDTNKMLEGRNETNPLHPLSAASFIDSCAATFTGEINRWQVVSIGRLIASHMGQWDSCGVLPKPTHDDERFVHMCDYLASRKYLTCDLDNE